METTHGTDADCTLDPATDCCTECGVYHADPCDECGGRGFHACPCSQCDCCNADEPVPAAGSLPRLPLD